MLDSEFLSKGNIVLLQAVNYSILYHLFSLNFEYKNYTQY